MDSLSQSFGPTELTPEAAVNACRRGGEIGADGVVFYTVGTNATVAMTVINSDGSEGGMCGNALRCLAEILREQTGMESCRVRLADRVVGLTSSPRHFPKVLMGEPRPIEGTELFSDHRPWNTVIGRPGHFVSFGNPHYVVPVSKIPGNWEELGRALQEPAHQLLGTGGLNVGFVEVDPGEDGVQELRVYERGAGATKSCGSGACAASAVLEFVLHKPSPHRLRLTGGVLSIGRENEQYTLSGPAHHEYNGTWNI